MEALPQLGSLRRRSFPGPWEDAYLTPERVARASWRRPHTRVCSPRTPGLAYVRCSPKGSQLPTLGNLNRRFLCKRMMLPEGSSRIGDLDTHKGIDPTRFETFFKTRFETEGFNRAVRW